MLHKNQENKAKRRGNKTVPPETTTIGENRSKYKPYIHLQNPIESDQQNENEDI